jgi:hypothetical protein
VEDAAVAVVAGKALECQLIQQGREAVVAGAAPLAAQVNDAAIGAGAAQHAPAYPAPGFQHPHPAAGALQPAGSDQAREPGTHDQHIHFLSYGLIGWGRCAQIGKLWQRGPFGFR